MTRLPVTMAFDFTRLSINRLIPIASTWRTVLPMICTSLREPPVRSSVLTWMPTQAPPHLAPEPTEPLPMLLPMIEPLIWCC